MTTTPKSLSPETVSANQLLEKEQFPLSNQRTISFQQIKAEGARFILGGLTTTLVCWGILLILVEAVHTHYLVGANVATFISYFYSYYLNKYFVFRNHEKTHIKHGGRFLLLQIFLWGVANAILFFGVDVLGLHYFVVLVFLASLVAALNFSLMKIAVFN